MQRSVHKPEFARKFNLQRYVQKLEFARKKSVQRCVENYCRMRRTAEQYITLDFSDRIPGAIYYNSGSPGKRRRTTSPSSSSSYLRY